MRQYEFGDKVVNSVGTGGAATKASAARLAQDNGVGALVTSADNIADALAGRQVGTWFAPADDERAEDRHAVGDPGVMTTTR